VRDVIIDSVGVLQKPQAASSAAPALGNSGEEDCSENDGEKVCSRSSTGLGEICRSVKR
jgi:hypothetical protein